MSVWCDEVWYREALTGHRCSAVHSVRGGGLGRGEGDAVTCGWEYVCIMRCVIPVRRAEGGKHERTVAESLEHVTDIEGQGAGNWRCWYEGACMVGIFEL